MPNSWRAIQLTNCVLLVLAGSLIWFIPITHDICYSIDVAVFKFLNQSLTPTTAWTYLWGYLNHPNETWLNILVMIGLNLAGIFSLPKLRRSSALAGVIYFWLFFQLVIILTHWVFTDLLDSARLSPSIVIDSIVDLGASLNIPGIKVYCNRCFPAGHTLVLFYWAKFAMLYSKEWLHKIIIFTATLFLLPRLFSGAHWLSDIVFTACLSLLWYQVAISTQLFPAATKFIEKSFNLLQPSKRQNVGAT